MDRFESERRPCWRVAIKRGRKANPRKAGEFERLRLNNLISHRVSHEFTYRVNFQFTHDIGAVRLRRLHADAQHRSNFLAALPFRQQLYDFPFTGSQAVAYSGGNVRVRLLPGC